VSPGTLLSDQARSLRAAVASDATVVTAAKLLQNTLGFALSLAVLHKFGLAGVGLLTIASLAVVIQATLLAFGLPYVLAKSPLPISQRNMLGAIAGGLGLVISLPIGAALGLAFGSDPREALVIALLSLGGPYFAQSALADALLVLQGRARRAVISPLGGTAGLSAAYLFADDYVTFAALLAAGRFAGSATVLASLPLQWCGWSAFVGHLKHGLRYLGPDTMGLTADQLSVAIVAMLATRAELGVFGLCRQLLTAADTPMWSRLLIAYPGLCERPRNGLALQTRMLHRGAVIAAAVAVLSVGLGLWVYRLPDVARLAPLLMLSVPFRYVAGTGEFALRAIGAIAAVNWLTGARCALAPLLAAGLLLAGLTGAIVAIVLQSLVLAVLARSLLRWRLARLPAERPSAGVGSPIGVEVTR